MRLFFPACWLLEIIFTALVKQQSERGSPATCWATQARFRKPDFTLGEGDTVDPSLLGRFPALWVLAVTEACFYCLRAEVKPQSDKVG